MGNPKKVWRKKNVFAQKYDEIRRLDGIAYICESASYHLKRKTKSEEEKRGSHHGLSISNGKPIRRKAPLSQPEYI
jgi:hypothetical protein